MHSGRGVVHDARHPVAAPSSSSSGRPRRRTARRLFAFDRALGFRYVAGADEAGRGSLAGPLVAAAVLFDLERITPRDVRALGRLNDSKQCTEECREELYPIVMRTAVKVSVVSRCARRIDTRGLHRTNLDALREALARVASPSTMGRDPSGGARGICLSDGFPLGKDFPYPLRAVVDGDTKSAAIAAASIVAKVTRDRFMRRADADHPGWDFATHVGYSTPEHRAAIRERGVSPLHRLSFQSLAYQQLDLVPA